MERKKKTIIIYSSLTGNTKAVAEKAFEVLDGEKELLAIEEQKKIDWTAIKNVVFAFWVDKGTADPKTKKFLSSLEGKHLFFLGTLGAAPDSFHGNKCYKNVRELSEKKNHFQDGILIRGKVAESLTKTLSFKVLQTIVPNIKEIIKEAESHPNKEDFLSVQKFIQEKVNPYL